MHLAGANRQTRLLTHHSTSSLSRRRKAGQNQRVRSVPRGGPLKNAALRLASSSTPSGRCSSSPSRSSLAHVLHRRPGIGGPTWRRTPPRSHPAVPVAIPGHNASIAADLRELTSGSHLAGTPASSPVASTSRCPRSYPGHGSLSLLRPDGFPLAARAPVARGSRGRGATRRAIVPHVRACPAGPSRRWCSSTSAANR